jgi:hypothetical protein
MLISGKSRKVAAKCSRRSLRRSAARGGLSRHFAGGSLLRNTLPAAPFLDRVGYRI